MAEADPSVDISYTRPMVGVPSSLSGLVIGPNTIVAQDCRVSNTFPGDYVVTVSGGVDVIAAPPMKGLLLVIDNRASAKDVFVAPTTGVLPPGTSQAQVLAGTMQLVLGDGSGWRLVPDSGTGGGASPTFTSALARGMVDANVPALATFAVAGAGRDGITYVQGDIVVLNFQTTVAQNGPYVVGAVGGGTAPLTRPPWWAAGSTIPSDFNFNLGSEGTVYGGLVLRTTVAGKVVDTDDPVLLFRSVGCQVNSGAGPTFAVTKGFTTVVRNAQGDYTLTGGPGCDFTKSALAFTKIPAVAGLIGAWNVTALTTSTVRVETYDMASAQQDRNFSCNANFYP